MLPPAVAFVSAVLPVTNDLVTHFTLRTKDKLIRRAARKQAIICKYANHPRKTQKTQTVEQEVN